MKSVAIAALLSLASFNAFAAHGTPANAPNSVQTQTQSAPAIDDSHLDPNKNDYLNGGYFEGETDGVAPNSQTAAHAGHDVRAN